MTYTPEHRIGAQQSKGFQYKMLWGASPGFTVGQSGPAGTMKSAMDAWETSSLNTNIEAVAIGLSNSLTNMPSGWVTAMQNETRFKIFAVPMVPSDSSGSLTLLLNGNYDAQITSLFTQLVTNGLGGLDVSCRIGWEFNSGSAGGTGAPSAYPSSGYTSGFQWATGHVDPQTGTANGIANYLAAAQYFENLIRQPSVGYTGYIEWNGGTQDSSALPIGTAMPQHATGVNKAKTLWGWDLYPGVPYNVGKDNVAATWTSVKNVYNTYVAWCRSHGYMMGHGELGMTYKVHSPYTLNDNSTFWPLLYALFQQNTDVDAYFAIYHQNQHVKNPPGHGWPNFTDLAILDEMHQMWYPGGHSGTASTTVWTGANPPGATGFNVYGNPPTEATMGSLQGVDTTPSFWEESTDPNTALKVSSFKSSFGGGGGGAPGLQAPAGNPATNDTVTGTDTLKVTRNLHLVTTDYGVKNMLVNPSLDVATTNWFTSGTGTVTRDTSIFRTSPASLKWNPGTTLGSLQYYSVAAEPGAYTLSAWVYVPSGSGLTSIDCGLVSYTGINNTGYTSIVQTNFPVTVYDTWFRITQTLSSMAAGINALGPKLIPHGSGIFYVDDMQLERGSSATTVSPFESVSAVMGHVTNTSMTENTFVSDSVARIRTYTRNTAESIPTTDAVALRSANVTRPLTESAVTTSAVARVLTTSRAVSQSGTTSDATTRVTSHNFSAALSDSTTQSDTVATGGQISRTVSDGGALSESITGQVGYMRGFAETVQGVDVLQESLTTVRTITASTTVSEALTRINLLSRALTETVQGTDTSTRLVTTARTVTVSSTLVETVVGHGGQNRPTSDVLTTSMDAVARQMTAPRAMTQPTAVFDQPTRTYVSARSNSETTSLTDATFRRAVTFTRSPAETFVLADTVGSAEATVRALSETTARPTDVASRSGGSPVVRFFTDIAHATDAVAGGKGNNRALSEHVNGADALARTGMVFLRLSDTVYGSAAATRVLVTTRQTVDHTVLHEVLFRHISSVRVINPSRFGPVRGRPGRTAILTSPTTRARPGPTMMET